MAPMSQQLSRILLLLSLFLGPGIEAATLPGGEQSPRYICPPCKHEESLFQASSVTEAGACKVCGMQLVEKPLGPGSDGLALHEGSGSFLIDSNTPDAYPLAIFYHRPENLREDAPVVIVIPGAGRNAWRYRDTWVDAAEKYGALVLVPHYSETYYPEFWNYNIAGMIDNVRINETRTRVESYDINRVPDTWLFNDFDKIFDVAVEALGLSTNAYDLFGHSAGGQVLHRFALFAGDSKARRILASNSGWYTAPRFDKPFPYGIGSDMLDRAQLKKAFSRELVVFLGELDNADESRGHLVRTPEIDWQGEHRLSRGQYFFAQAQERADELDTDLRWKLKVITGVGHDYTAMGEAAAAYLYAGKESHQAGPGASHRR
ncbi:hypothetical protein [Microbulbifer sediminum]|uniref:hypothetical protein n=1 Tax=Microbulbifer sediminum TaxID=2904250 RepID=UPI001F36E272|nr:hypothetical protein [Microbulbifer sediminum]